MRHSNVRPAAAGTAYDLFRGTAASQRDEVDHYPSALEAEVKFGAKSHPECAR